MPIPRSLRLFARSTTGATAVEFAIVAPLFFALMFSFFEAGWLMTRSILQDSAVSKVVRELKIGAHDSLTADEMKDRICDEALVFVQCESSTMVEMIPLRAASDVIPTDSAACVHRGEAPAFVPGERSEFVFVRVCTSVTPITPFLGLAVALPDEGGNAYGIVTRAAFVNEPQ